MNHDLLRADGDDLGDDPWRTHATVLGPAVADSVDQSADPGRWRGGLETAEQDLGTARSWPDRASSSLWPRSQDADGYDRMTTWMRDHGYRMLSI